MFFDDIPSEFFQQGEAFIFNMANDCLGDGAVVGRVVVNILAVTCFVRRVVDHQVDQDILMVIDLFIFHTDESTQPKIFNTNNCIGLTK